MTLRLGEKLVLVGAGLIVIFAGIVGTLIYLKPPPVRYAYLESEASKSGEAVFRRESCPSCHEVFANGASYGPTLDGVGSRRDGLWLAEYLRSPRPGVSAKPYRLRMPAYDKLKESDFRALVSYLEMLRRMDEHGSVINPPAS